MTTTVHDLPRETFKPSYRFALVPFSDIQPGGERSYLVKGLIPRPGLTVVYGAPKCGKSFFATDIALHVALGWQYRERRVVQGPVVYIACEGAEGYKARLAAFREHHGIEATTAVPFYLVAGSLDLINEHDTLIADIRAQAGEAVPVAVYVDTLNRTLNGSESSDEDMSAYVRAADAITQAFGCATIIIHHCGIEASRPRGHTSLTGAADAQIAVKKHASGHSAATIEFMKDGPEGDCLGFRLDVVEVGADADGDPITSCIIEPEEAAPEGEGKQLRGRKRAALDQLYNALENGGEDAPAGPHFPRTKQVVREDVWREYIRRAGIFETDKPDNFRRSFARVRTELQNQGFIGSWDGYVWAA